MGNRASAAGKMYAFIFRPSDQPILQITSKKEIIMIDQVGLIRGLTLPLLDRYNVRI